MATTDNASEERDWCNPVVAWHGYAPVVSSGHKPGHNGVDVMFRRQGLPVEDAFKPGTPNGSPGYFCPDGVLVVAAADGLLWSSSRSDGGLQVVLDHGKPWATYYQHLDRLFVPLGVAKGQGKIRIRRGEPLGVVGYSPKDGEKLKHLHFELWKNGAGSAHVDPQAYGFDAWPVISRALTRAQQVAALALLFFGAFVLPRFIAGGFS